MWGRWWRWWFGGELVGKWLWLLVGGELVGGEWGWTVGRRLERVVAGCQWEVYRWMVRRLEGF